MINITVCGKFHYPKYLKYLTTLNNFYCSYKINSNFELPQKKIINLFLKEYMLYIHLASLGQTGLRYMLPFYHKIWQRAAMKKFVPSDINHFMIHGNCIKLIEKCNSLGKITIGEAVNAHPLFQDKLLKLEAEKREIKHAHNSDMIERMIMEFNSVDYLLVASTFVKNTFTENGFDKNKIILIPYGIDNKLIKKNNVNSISNNNIKILCVGQIIHRKGQYYLVEAVKLLNELSKNKFYDLTLVGRCDPIYMDRIMQLSSKFTHVQHIKQNNMENFMSEFDMMVIPSIEDGFSVVVTEALAVGLPVITTKNNGAADMIIDGENGIIIEAGDTKEIKNAIERIIDEKIIGENRNLFTWKNYAENLEINYEKILCPKISN